MQMHLLALLSLSSTAMTDFPTLSCTSTSEIPTLSYTRILKKVPLSQPRPQGFSLKKWMGRQWGFSRPTHFLREKPWGRRCPFRAEPPRIGHYRKYPPNPDPSESEF